MDIISKYNVKWEIKQYPSSINYVTGEIKPYPSAFDNEFIINLTVTGKKHEVKSMLRSLRSYLEDQIEESSWFSRGGFTDWNKVIDYKPGLKTMDADNDNNEKHNKKCEEEFVKFQKEFAKLSKKYDKYVVLDLSFIDDLRDCYIGNHDPPDDSELDDSDSENECSSKYKSLGSTTSYLNYNYKPKLTKDKFNIYEYTRSASFTISTESKFYQQIKQMNKTEKCELP